MTIPADWEPTERLATRLTQGTPVDDCSSLIVEKAFVDTVACMLAGSSSPATRMLAAFVQTGPDLEAAAVGLGVQACAADAALLGGTAAHALELDDYSLVSSGHPSAVLVPAVLAVGARSNCSGHDLLDAYAVGYEAILFFGSLFRPPHHFAGFPSCALGAAAATSMLLRAGTAEMRTSLGIAASLCVELRANFGTSTKPLLCGRASAAGVLAGQLAHAGFDASPSILEAPGGMLAACAPRPFEMVEAALQQLEASAFTPGASPPTIKKFASCGGTHSVIEATLRLRPKLGSRPIWRVVVEGPEYYQTSLRFHRPATVAEAKFSAEASVAVAIVDGSAGIAQFTDESLARPEVQSLIGKTSLISSEHLDQVFENQQTLPAGVTIETEAGTFATEVLFPPGTRQLPMSLAEVIDKLESCAPIASRVIDAAALTEELETISALKTLDRLQSLLKGS